MSDNATDPGPTTYQLCRDGNTFADTIKRQLPEYWSQWVVFLLEALEDERLGDELLEDVRDEIEGRLEAGRW